MFRLLIAVAGLLAGSEESESNKPSAAPADSWPQFRGTLEMTGVSSTKLPEKPELLWSVKTGEPIEATVAIADGIVYSATLDGAVRAVRLADGGVVWTAANKEKDGVKGSPCIAGELLIYGDEAGMLKALNRRTGITKWTRKVDGPMASSPTVVRDRVIVGSDDSYLYCFDLKTGEPRWKVQTGDRVNCAPSLAGDQVVVAGCDGYVRLVAVDTGKETKQLELGGHIAATPAVSGKQLIVGTMNNTIVSIDWQAMKLEWTFEDEDGKYPFFASTALTEDLALVGGRDKKMHAIERKTGKERWKFATRGKIDSSPLVADGRVYFGSDDGRFYAVDLATGKESWKYTCGPKITAGPAAAAGRLVVGDQDGTLYCFGAK